MTARKQPAKKRKSKAKAAGQNGHLKKGLKYSDEDIIAVLKSAGGIILRAAKKLGCARQTIYNRIESSKTVATAREEINETNLDLAEDQLLKAIKEGHMTAIIFYLKTQGKDRGYSERHEVNGNSSNAHYYISDEPMTSDEWNAKYCVDPPTRTTNGIN